MRKSFKLEGLGRGRRVEEGDVRLTCRHQARTHTSPRALCGPSELEQRFRIAIESGALLDEQPSGKLRKKLELAMGFVADHRALLLDRWIECNPA
jgi:hypothetical protein